MSLNAKQRQFVKEYLVDKNATRAAIAAGYSEQTARQMGSENLSKPDIKKAIQEGLAAHARDAELRALAIGISKERWLEEAAVIAFSNIDDVVKIKQARRSNGTDGDEYYVNYAEATPTNQRSPLIGRAIKKISETKNGIGIEMHSKQAALELIGKHFGWVKDKIEHSGPEGGPQVFVMLPSNGREVAEHTNNGNPSDGNSAAASTTDSEPETAVD